MTLSVGGIISKTFEMIRERIGSLIGMWFVYFAIQIVAMIVVFAVAGASLGMATSIENPTASLGAGMILLLIIFYLGYILIYCAQTASLNALATPLRQLGFGDAFSAGLRSALPLLGLIVILAIGYFICAFVFGLVFGLLSFAGTVGSVIGALIGVALLIYAASRLSIVFPTIAVEGVRNPVSAIGRSWSLTGGNVLPIFLATLVYFLIAALLFVVAFLPALGSVSAMAGGDVGSAAVGPAIGSMAFMFIGFFVISIFVAIFGAAMQSVIHAQLSGSTGEDLHETFA